MIVLQRGDEVPQIVGERQSGRRDRGGEAGKERDPSRHEAPCRAVGLTEIDILAAGLRKIYAEFGVAQGAREGEQRAHAPRRQNQPGASEIARHESGCGENARTGHVRNDKGGRAEEADLPQQAGLEGLSRAVECGHVASGPL